MEIRFLIYAIPKNFERSFFMKKLLAVALCLVVSLGMVACGGEPGLTPSESIAQGATTGSVGVEIGEATVTKDTSDADAVVVAFKFTNNTNKARQFKMSTTLDVKQGDKKLDPAIIAIGDVYKEGVATKSIEPGASIDVQMCYILVDTTTPLSVVCNITSGEDKATVEKEITL